MQETWVWSLGQEDPLEKGMSNHSSILAWEIPWIEEPGSLYYPWGLKELDMTERLKTNTHPHVLLNPFSPLLLNCYYRGVSTKNVEGKILSL